MSALQVQGFRLFPALSLALIIPPIDGFVLWDLDLAIIQLTLYNAFYQVMMPQYGADPAECYEARFYSYGLFGFLDEWIKRGVNETPEQITALFRKMMSSKSDEEMD